MGSSRPPLHLCSSWYIMFMYCCAMCCVYAMCEGEWVIDSSSSYATHEKCNLSISNQFQSDMRKLFHNITYQSQGIVNELIQNHSLWLILTFAMKYIYCHFMLLKLLLCYFFVILCLLLHYMYFLVLNTNIQ